MWALHHLITPFDLKRPCDISKPCTCVDIIHQLPYDQGPHLIPSKTLPSLVATAHHVMSRFDSLTVGTDSIHEMDSLS